MPGPTADWRLPMPIPRHGPARPSSTSPVPESSRATAPLENTRKISGSCTCPLLSDMRDAMSEPTNNQQVELLDSNAADPLLDEHLFPANLPTPGAPAGIEPSELSQRPTVKG